MPHVVNVPCTHEGVLFKFGRAVRVRAGLLVYWPVTTQLMTEPVGLIKQKKVLFLRCSTYKDEFKDGAGGYHVEKGRGPRPLGGWWLRFKFSATQRDVIITDIPTDEA